MDVWYSLDVVNGREYTVRVNGANNMDAVVSIYNGCGAANNIGGLCADFFGDGGTEEIVFTATSTTTLLIRVYDWDLDIPLGGDFRIRVIQTPIPPSNDLCSGATAVGIGASVDGTNIAATADGLFAPCSGVSAGSAMVFHTTSVTQTGNGENNVGFSTDFDNTDFDTQIGVYTGTCAAPVCVDGDDDSGDGFTSFLPISTTATTNYIVAVRGFAGDRGCYTYSPVQLPSIRNIAAGAAGVGCDVPIQYIQPGCCDHLHRCIRRFFFGCKRPIFCPHRQPANSDAERRTCQRRNC